MSSAQETQSRQVEKVLVTELTVFCKVLAIVFCIWCFGQMGLSFTWLFIILAAYFYSSYLKKSRRAELDVAQAIAKNERHVLASVASLPSWVFFPDIERAEWLNVIILRCWPFIRTYVIDMIQTSIIPAVKENLPGKLQSFKFTDLDLGDIPPRIAGVKVYTGDNIRRHEVVMDLDIAYFSDTNISLRWGLIKAGIKELQFRGTLRLVLKPLVSQMPIVGCISVTFLSNPYINFDLTDLGNLLDAPGLRQLLVNCIADQVANLMVLPNLIVVPLISDLDLSRLRHPLPQAVLRVEILAAADIISADIGFLRKGKSDPYVVAKVGSQKYKTKTIRNTVSPIWDEMFEVIIMALIGQQLELQMFDEDPGNKDDSIGSAVVDLDTVAKDGELDSWVKLEDVKSGSVHVRLTWCNLSSNYIEESQTDTRLSSALLYICVDSCKNLPKVKVTREPSSYVKLFIAGNGKSSQQTKVKEATPHPIFEEVFCFFIKKPSQETLNVVVLDSMNNKVLGECEIRLRILLSEKDLEMECPFLLKTFASDECYVNLRLVLRTMIPGKCSDVQAGHDENVDKLFRSSDTTALTTVPTTATITLSERSEPASANHQFFVSSSCVPNAATPNTTVTTSTSDNNTSDLIADADIHRRSSDIRGRLQLTLRYSDVRNLLVVVVHQAENLTSTEKESHYVVVMCLTRGKMISKHKTDMKKNTVNPIFDESFGFNLSPTDLQQSVLRFFVKRDLKVFSRAEKEIGWLDLPLITLKQVSTEWHLLTAPIRRERRDTPVS